MCLVITNVVAIYCIITIGGQTPPNTFICINYLKYNYCLVGLIITVQVYRDPLSKMISP